MSEDTRSDDEAEEIEALDEQWEALMAGGAPPRARSELAQTVAALHDWRGISAPVARRIWSGAHQQAHAEPEPTPIKRGRQSVGFLPPQHSWPARLLAVAALLLALLGSSLGDWRDALHGSFPVSTASAEAATPAGTGLDFEVIATAPADTRAGVGHPATATVIVTGRMTASPTAPATPGR